jgi:hypothetical protein
VDHLGKLLRKAKKNSRSVSYAEDTLENLYRPLTLFAKQTDDVSGNYAGM